ncbi:MAG: aminotransferase class I/II-fold pyridoxal phosphate-dependent enzyme, partial [Limnobacter sp.]|nr:aminotransferase class I/II-fold pyridoxal phosphate-dependent enzyme [Limnobacter sp.]
MHSKTDLNSLALAGGPKLFNKPISTSNLVKPSLKPFLARVQSALTPSGEHALVEQLERELAAFHHCQHVVAVCSGFWALVLAIKALALPHKTEVVMPSLTYRRLADVVAWTGLTPHFCEVDADTLAISPATAEPHINEHTALLIGVHPIVNCCDAPGLEKLAKKNNLPVLFDGVESVYEWKDGRKVGSFGDA